MSGFSGVGSIYAQNWNAQQAAPTAASGGLGGMSGSGGAMMIAGMAVQAVGSFYAAKSQRYQLRSAALSADFDSSMASLNARAAEQDAQLLLEAGNREVGASGLRYGQVKGAQRASTAAAGIQAGVGSAAEVAATTDVAREIDSLTIRSNAVRAANAARTQAVNQRNRSLLSSVSAQNLRASARTINPWISAGVSLVGNSGQAASYFASTQGRY